MLICVLMSPGLRSSRDYPAAGSSSRRRGRGGKRLKHQETINQGSPALRGTTGATLPPTSSFPLGPATTSSSWPTSVGSQASLPSVPYPPGMLPLYPLYPPLSQPLADATALQTGLRFPMQNVQMPPQMVPPMMALVLPNYMFPQINAPLAQPCPAIAAAGTVPFFNPNAAFVPPFAAAAGVNPNVALPTLQQMPTATQVPRPTSRSSTPHSISQREGRADREGAESMLLPSSRCSSPLNLLQLEEPLSNRLEATPTGGQGDQFMTNQRGAAEDSKENDNVSTNAVLQHELCILPFSDVEVYFLLWPFVFCLSFVSFFSFISCVVSPGSTGRGQ